MVQLAAERDPAHSADLHPATVLVSFRESSECVGTLQQQFYTLKQTSQYTHDPVVCGLASESHTSVADMMMDLKLVVGSCFRQDAPRSCLSFCAFLFLTWRECANARSDFQPGIGVGGVKQVLLFGQGCERSRSSERTSGAVENSCSTGMWVCVAQSLVSEAAMIYLVAVRAEPGSA